MVQRNRYLKSRRDNTLLTVGVTYGETILYILLASQRRHYREMKVSSLRDLGCVCRTFVRRLKSTVNKVLSLRDFGLKYLTILSFIRYMPFG